MAMAKNCLQVHSTIGYSPREVIEAMNRIVALSLQSGILMTCCYCLIDPRHGTLTYSNAGHNFPYHYKRNSDKLEQLESTDILLGVPGFEEAGFHEEERTWRRVTCFYSIWTAPLKLRILLVRCLRSPI